MTTHYEGRGGVGSNASAEATSRVTEPRPHIVVADDHRLFAEGVSRILKANGYLVSIVTQLAGLEETIVSVDPDLVLLDLSFGKETAFPLLQHLRATRPNLRIIVVSALDDTVIVEAVERTGAGYLPKSRASKDLLAAVKASLGGVSIIRTRLPTSVPAHRTIGAIPLTRRQIEVLLGLHRGEASAEIGAALGVSTKAIDPHIHALRERIGVRSRAELVRWAEAHLDELRR